MVEFLVRLKDSKNVCLVNSYKRCLILYLSVGHGDPSGRASDSGTRGLGFEPKNHRVVSLRKTLLAPKSIGKYPESGGYVPT